MFQQVSASGTVCIDSRVSHILLCGIVSKEELVGVWHSWQQELLCWLVYGILGIYMTWLDPHGLTWPDS